MANLHTLEDDALVESLRTLELRHCETMASIIEHLVELERRWLYRKLGYPSLYEYCMRALGLSEDEAYRRIAVARMAERQPAIVAGLAEGSLHLSGLVALVPHFRRASAETAAELLEMARRQSRREIERRLAARFPQADAPEIVRQERGQIDPLSPGRYCLQLTISQAARDKLERALELMSHQNPEHALAPVLDSALDALLEKLERAQRAKLFGRTRHGDALEQGKALPTEKLAPTAGMKAAPRRKPQARPVIQATPVIEPASVDERQLDLWEFAAARVAPMAPAPARASTTASREQRPTRHVPRPLRRATFERAVAGDGEGCCFISEDGRRCGSRHFLELDHATPWSLERQHRAANLRVFCRAHNQLLAEELMGARQCG